MHAARQPRSWLIFDVRQKMNDERRNLTSQSFAVSVAAIVSCAVAVFLHAFAGWYDEGKVVLRPVGHLTVFVAFAWLSSFVLALVAIVHTRARSIAPWCALVFASLGLLFLFSS